MNPFDVLRFPYQFKGDPETITKLWIVARNLQAEEILICFKPTSITERYDREVVSLAGVVEYAPDTFPFFNVRTIIGPDPSYPIPYSHLRSCYANSKLEVVGRLPEDFREKMLVAAESKPEWRRKDREYFSLWFR